MAGPGIITKDPAILSGEPVFRGTRVPFKALLDYLEGGDTLDDFLEQYPSVTRQASRDHSGRGAFKSSCPAQMRVLIDECAPAELKVFLSSHGVDCTEQSSC
jgi:uncharacterized protein (DUF433 family)